MWTRLRWGGLAWSLIVAGCGSSSGGAVGGSAGAAGRAGAAGGTGVAGGTGAAGTTGGAGTTAGAGGTAGVTGAAGGGGTSGGVGATGAAGGAADGGAGAAGGAGGAGTTGGGASGGAGTQADAGGSGGRGGAAGAIGGTGGTGGMGGSAGAAAPGGAGGAAIAGTGGGGGRGGTAGGGVAGGPWTRVQTSFPRPPPGPTAALIHDAARGVVVLLTGSQDPNKPLTTWELDVATWQWTNRQPSPAPPVDTAWPRSRNAFGAAYDARRGRTFLFGGYNLIYFHDFWEWDGVTGAWTPLTPNPLPANWPRNRYGVSLAYDGDRGKLVLFGGVGTHPMISGYLVHNDVWEWDAEGRAWTNRTVDPLPTAWPAGRQSPGVVYDQDRKRVVIFGGDGGAAPSISPMRLADIWEWDGAAGTWTNRTPSPLPSAGWPGARMAPAAAYDPTRARMMMLGGEPLTPELWEWSPATSAWTNRTVSPIPTNWPSARSGSGMLFLPTTGRILLWGGTGLSGSFIGALDDLWSWQPPSTAP